MKPFLIVLCEQLKHIILPSCYARFTQFLEKDLMRIVYLFQLKVNVFEDLNMADLDYDHHFFF